MIKRYFITGTDTEVGKTIASIALLQAAQQHGYITAGYKPVASGAKLSAEGLQNIDVLLLKNNSSLELDYHEVNKYTFAEFTSPHILSINEDKPIDFSVLSNGLRTLENKANWILIEGVGGWFTPISNKKTFSNWVILENLQVILVVGVKVGCINHAILTSQAISRSGLHLAGWITNCTLPFLKWYAEYITSLEHFLSAPLIGNIPWLGREASHINISSYLDFKVINS